LSALAFALDFKIALETYPSFSYVSSLTKPFTDSAPMLFAGLESKSKLLKL
jgi:hypothetical protein